MLIWLLRRGGKRRAEGIEVDLLRRNQESIIYKEQLFWCFKEVGERKRIDDFDLRFFIAQD